MTIELGATPQVQRTIKKGLPVKLALEWERLKAQLHTDPWFAGADKKQVWKPAFPRIPNHRHADLPEAWRCSWTIRVKNEGQDFEVTVLFLGAHKEYDRLYGFKTT